MRKHSATIALGTTLLFTACGTLPRQLESESGLYNVPLQHSLKLDVDGYWLCNTQPGLANGGRIYVALLDVRLVEKGNEEYMPLMQNQMHDYMKAELEKALQEQHRDGAWTLTEDRGKADVCMEMALVRFSPQKPVLRVLSTIGSYLLPIPGAGTLATSFTKGDICVEAVIRDARTQEPLVVFKDSNRASVRLYTADAYSKEGNADANLQLWARKMAGVCAAYGQARRQGKNLQQLIDERSVAEGLWKRVR